MGWHPFKGPLASRTAFCQSPGTVMTDRVRLRELSAPTGGHGMVCHGGEASPAYAMCPVLAMRRADGSYTDPASACETKPLNQRLHIRKHLVNTTVGRDGKRLVAGGKQLHNGCVVRRQVDGTT